VSLYVIRQQIVTRKCALCGDIVTGGCVWGTFVIVVVVVCVADDCGSTFGLIADFYTFRCCTLFRVGSITFVLLGVVGVLG
jgi:hypothetical protein